MQRSAQPSPVPGTPGDLDSATRDTSLETFPLKVLTSLCDLSNEEKYKVLSLNSVNTF